MIHAAIHTVRCRLRHNSAISANRLRADSKPNSAQCLRPEKPRPATNTKAAFRLRASTRVDAEGGVSVRKFKK